MFKQNTILIPTITPPVPTPKSSCEINIDVVPDTFLIPPKEEPVQEVLPEKSYCDHNLCGPLQEPIKWCEKYFRLDELFSELDTEQKKLVARKNLGLSLGMDSGSWGSIEGDITDQEDLPDYILEVTTNKVTADYPDQAESSKKLKYIVKNKDLVLNDAYRNALEEVLYGNAVKSIDDAINLLFHVLFPVEYKNWILEVTNTATKTYDIEVGTSVSLNPNTLLGNIVINLHQGNKGDSIQSLQINGHEIYQSGVYEYTYPIYIKDITSQSSTTKSIKKQYTINMLTDSNVQDTQVIDVGIQVTTFRYYFYEMSDSLPTYTQYLPSEHFSKSGTFLFQIGNQEKYLSVISPKRVTKVETAAGISIDTLTNFYVTDGWSQEQITYIPSGGSPQTYYRITLDTPQSLFVKIKVT